MAEAQLTTNNRAKWLFFIVIGLMVILMVISAFTLFFGSEEPDISVTPPHTCEEVKPEPVLPPVLPETGVSL